jgi:purine-binding chemotaxis protein CheW
VPAGRYMAFKLGREEYAVGILEVRELIGMMQITRVPGARAFVRGVINLRGKIIPVIDLRLRLGMATTVPTDQTVIMLVQHTVGTAELVMALLVDEVLEVLDLGAHCIEPPPELGAQPLAPAFVVGVAKVDDRVVFLLDIDRVLPAEEPGIAVAGPS